MKGIVSMYFFDFIFKMIRRANIAIICYLALNVLIIGGIASIIFNVEYQQGCLMGLGFYIVSLMIAISPIGEWLLRIKTGCKKVKRIDQKDFFEPIFKEVYDRAKEANPAIPNNVHWFINNDELPNAFATGRRTICVTEGLLYMPENQIKAVLAHEFGHLSNKDTDLLLLVSIGNFVVGATILIIRFLLDTSKLVVDFCANILGAVMGGREGFFVSLLASLTATVYHAMFAVTVTFLTWVWTKIGILLVMKSSRSIEFDADKFAFTLGYGNDLCLFLDRIGVSGAKGLFASLASSHPDKDKRIEKLQKMGASYMAYYGG